MAIGSIYRPFLDLLRESGVDVDTALAQLGVSYAQMVEGGARLTPEQGRMFAQLFAQVPAGIAVGLRAAERFSISDAALVGYVMRSAPSALAAVEALAKHARLIGDSADFRVERAGDRVILKLALSGGRTFLPEGSDFAAAALFKLIRECSGGRVVPISVELPRDRPRLAAPYFRFFGVPVGFGAEVATLTYAEASMRAPLVHSDNQLARILEEHAQAVATTLPPADDWLATMRAYIAEDLAHGAPALAALARRCGAGERTVRRRLSAAGTSFRALVDDVRKERALALLAERQSVSVVAQQLGFADATGFARAFRRWTGRLPHQER